MKQVSAASAASKKSAKAPVPVLTKAPVASPSPTATTDLAKLDKNPEIVALTKSGTLITSAATSLTIRTDADRGRAADLKGQIKTSLDNLESMRTFFVKPLNDQVKRVNLLFKGLARPFESAKELVGQKLIADYRKQEEARIEEARATAAAAAAAEAKTAGASKVEVQEAAAEAADSATYEPPPTTVAGSTAAVQVRKRWTFEIVDANQVPRGYLMVDERTVKDAIRNGAREIPGLRIFEKEELATY